MNIWTTMEDQRLTEKYNQNPQLLLHSSEIDGSTITNTMQA